MIYMPNSTAVVQPDGGKPEIHQVFLGENALIPPLPRAAHLLTGHNSLAFWDLLVYVKEADECGLVQCFNVFQQFDQKS
ncbi:hypothetical protein TNIN_412061 [Trichonephila inaurata madagascariensis]|uniref:Uncharacterized protein n=1 Tax=Trichonephila inaurata madagascariensis TaxID=2747483 RepID=A0A8X6M716_9ARAC|nr:hypothetical protein TNIN_412061 [Trichonephila inaurata madagascariensis]